MLVMGEEDGEEKERNVGIVGVGLTMESDLGWGSQGCQQRISKDNF